MSPCLAQPVAITGYGLSSCTGGQAGLLFAAVACHQSFIQPDINYQATSPDGAGLAPVYLARAAGLSIDEPAVQMLDLFESALQDVSKSLPEELPDKPNLLLAVIPTEKHARGRFINTYVWEKRIKNNLHKFKDFDIRFVQSDCGIAALLQQVCAELNHGLWGCVVFGAVDSLIDPLTVQELGASLLVRSTKNSDGHVPGQAAGFVVLFDAEEARQLKLKPMGYLKGITSRSLETAQEISPKSLAGCFDEIMQAANLGKEDIDQVVSNTGSIREHLMEWHYVTTKLWPMRASEQETFAMQMGEIDQAQIDPADCYEPKVERTSISLGDIGCSAFVIDIIYTLARFDFDYPKIDNVFAYEIEDTGEHSVLYLGREHTSERQAA